MPPVYLVEQEEDIPGARHAEALLGAWFFFFLFRCVSRCGMKVKQQSNKQHQPAARRCLAGELP